MAFIEPCFGIGHNLYLICQMTSEDIKHQLTSGGERETLRYFGHFLACGREREEALRSDALWRPFSTVVISMSDCPERVWSVRWPQGVVCLSGSDGRQILDSERSLNREGHMRAEGKLPNHK